MRLSSLPYLRALAALPLLALACVPFAAQAHKLREKGVSVAIDDSPLTVTPGRDWNRLDGNIGKHTESWTLDGGQLNDVTFYTGIEPGKPLVRERNKKREPLPKFTAGTLLVEVPELLEATYRTSRQIANFTVSDIAPHTVLGQQGVIFRYQFVDQDELTRQGEARAAIVAGRLYMISFEAPRLHYFAAALQDYHQLAESARLP